MKSGRKRGTSHWEEKRIGGDGARQERRLAKEVGARPTLASGATLEAKSDAVAPEYRYEMKSTISKKLPVDKQVLAKIWREARSTGRVPVVAVTMESIESPVPKDWVVIELEVFKSLTGEGA